MLFIIVALLAEHERRNVIGMCNLDDFKDLKMTPDCRRTLELELGVWHRVYLPVKGTVLDVGAGSGETALFYLKHGADHVVCIECDPAALDNLRQNFGHEPRVTIIPVRIDNIKIDIEGSEEGMVLETHFPVAFSKEWIVPAPARDVILWKVKPNKYIQAFRRVQDAVHKNRIRIAHRTRLIIDRKISR